MECFAQSSSDGNVFIANGIDEMLVWDGLGSTAVPAGVIAPATALTIAGAGAGAITGTYYGWVRFLDARGNVSNLSPVSNAAILTADGQVNYTNVPVPTVGTVVRRQIIRNTNGSVGATDPVTGLVRNIAYVDIDTTDVSSTSFTSTRIDTDLATQESVDVDAASVENGVPPNDRPFLCWHQNFMFGVGAEPYQEGSCAVTFGSATVQGYGTRWKATFVGRFLYITGASKNYEIQSVDVTNQTITIAEPYNGTTDPWAEYGIRPLPARAKSINWSKANDPEAWNPEDELSLPEDGDRVVGAFNYSSYMYVVETRHMYRFICRDDPANDARIFLAVDRGAVNNRCWVIIDETCYLLDTGGIYAYKGDDQGIPISAPIQDMFNNQPGLGRKINWNASRYFHACHSPNEEVVRFFVALAGDYVPRHAIVVAYKEGKIWTEPLPFRASASVQGKIGGRVGTVQEAVEQYYVGSTGGRVLAPKGGSLDGRGFDGSFRGQVTAAGWLSLTDSNANFAAGAVNSPVAITGGKGRGQVRYITAQTATELTLNTPWSVKPDDTSLYCIGGVKYTYSSLRFRWLPGESDMARSVELEFQPNRCPNRLRVSFAPDFADPVRSAWTIDKGFRPDVEATPPQEGQDAKLETPEGYILIQQNSWREQTAPGSMGRTARLVMSGVSLEQPVQLGTVLVNGAAG